MGTANSITAICFLSVVASLAYAEDGRDDAGDAGEPGRPITYELVRFRDFTFDVVTVDLAHADVKLFWKDDREKTPIRGLRQLEQYLKTRGQELLFATNAGIYSQDFTPAGLHIEQGEQVKALNMRDGGGNFHLKPNGVFYADATGAHVIESTLYQQKGPDAFFATQSGPLLVHRGELHPKFRAESPSVYIRSGVGVPSPQQIVFALSREPVNFYTFASLYKDVLECGDALYLDGQISRFYMPGVLEEPGPAWYVGLLAVVAKMDAGESALE